SELVRLTDHVSVQALHDRFSASGVRPGAWGVPVDHGGEEAGYQAALRALSRVAALAQSLGTPWCATVIRPFSDERAYDANMEFQVARLRPVARILADHGCRLGLEFIGPKTLRDGHPYPFISTIDGALELGAQLGTGNVGLLLDAFHWYTSHATLADIQRLTAADIVYVHVNDAVTGRAIDEQMDLERDLPGATGLIDIAGFLRAVADTGFDGPVAVEPFSQAVMALEPDDRVRAAGTSLAQAWAAAGLA
ncbi:MAG: sugar phosphate isomerase/epimerase family protein, partial [Chloroflexota bacterium]